MPVPGSLILFHISFVAESFVFYVLLCFRVSHFGDWFYLDFLTERGVSLLFGSLFCV